MEYIHVNTLFLKVPLNVVFCCLFPLEDYPQHKSSPGVLVTDVTAFVISQTDYCNSLSNTVSKQGYSEFDTLLRK